MRICAVILLALGTFACSGGGSTDDSLVIQGTLTQGKGGHERILSKHGAGDRIGTVEICALGSCSTTDDEGQWGFSTAEHAPGGDVVFTIRGHGIDDVTEVDIPNVARDVAIDFVNNGGQVSAHEVVIDGAPHSGHSE